MSTTDETGTNYRGLVVCAALAVVALVIGVTAIIADDGALGLVAAVVAVAAAGVGAWVDVRRRRAEDSLWEARAHARQLRRELDAAEAARAEERSVADAQRETVGSIADEPPVMNTDDWEIDPVSGLLRERYLPVVLQQVIASARRKVQPVSVVFWEIDGVDDAAGEARTQALTALGAVAWRTLRESDSVFRLRDAVAVGVLLDTDAGGARLVAERVRDALRASAVGGALTASAGIACYPTHALDAAELVSCAGQALELARRNGHGRDHVVIAELSA